ncbi:MAG: DMT family transporter [Wenzhouxiangella sp.]|nr:DMT family transporter [Wenzhouxiangella sp.]
MSAGDSLGTPLKSALLVTAGAVMISFAAVFARLADVEPTTSGFYRMVFGTLGLLVLLAIRRDLRQGLGRGWGAALLIAALFAADIWFWHRSIVYVGPGLSTLLANFQVFILTAVGVVWMKERIGWRFASGLGLAMAGLWLLFGRDWGNLAADHRLGVIFGLLTALAYGLYILTLRGFQIRDPDLRPETRLTQVTICCGVLLGLINLAEGNSFAIPDGQSLAALVALGLLCQVGGWLLISRGMPFLPAAIVGLLLLLQPALSIIWDMLFFGLRMDSLQIVGSVLALVGIYLGFRSAAQRRAAG